MGKSHVRLEKKLPSASLAVGVAPKFLQEFFLPFFCLEPLLRQLAQILQTTRDNQPERCEPIVSQVVVVVREGDGSIG